jgi:hypothetical protein
MLNPRFLKIRIVSSLISHEQSKAIVEKYDRKYLFPIFLKCCYHLHPLVESKMGVVDKKVEKDKTLDIFEMTTSTSEPTTKLVNKELLIFIRYQVEIKDVQCPL